MSQQGANHSSDSNGSDINQVEPLLLDTPPEVAAEVTVETTQETLPLDQATATTSTPNQGNPPPLQLDLTGQPGPSRQLRSSQQPLTHSEGVQPTIRRRLIPAADLCEEYSSLLPCRYNTSSTSEDEERESIYSVHYSEHSDSDSDQDSIADIPENNPDQDWDDEFYFDIDMANNQIPQDGANGNGHQFQLRG